MTDTRPSATTRLATARTTALQVYRSHRTRRIALIVAIVLLVFGLLGFFAAPPIIKSQLQKQLSTQLDRSVSVGAVHLNPFTLRVEIDKLHIADRDGHSPFVDIDKAVANASWSSLFRMAPIMDAITLDHPQIRIVRTAPQQFNFSDILAKFANTPSKPGSKPTRFALYNIRVNNGDIAFNDAVSHATHRIDQLELGIPFIANLPRDADVFVKPLLAMNVDGSPLRIAGQTKPFADSRESVVTFTLDHLDLPRYLGYVPAKLPVAIPQGQLSGQLELHFTQAKAGPQVRLGGQLQLDKFALATPAGSPILELGHATAVLTDVEPLLSRYQLGAVSLDGLDLHYTSERNGHSNFDALTGGPSAKPAAVKSAATSPAAPATDVRIAALTLTNSRFDYTDATGRKPATLSLQDIHGTVRGLTTLAASPATVDVDATLNGGTLHAAGTLDIAHHRYAGKLDMQGVGLPPLMPLAPPMLNAELAKGTLDAGGQWLVDWSSALNLSLQDGHFAVNDLALHQHGTTPIAWRSLQAAITRFDLASHRAEVGTVSLRGLHVEARRLHDGNLDLAGLLKPTPPARGSRKATPAPAWHWSVAHLEIDGSTLALADPRLHGRRGTTTIKLEHAGIAGLSDDMHRPLKLVMNGGIGRGDFHIDGSLRPQPLDANLRVRTKGLDIAPLQAFAPTSLNVTLSSALLSADGRLRYREHQPDALIDWRGRATLGNVRVQDKLTGDDFLRWSSLAAGGMDVRLGAGAPQVSVADLALSNFYARVILNASGQLNLQDVESSNAAAVPVSVTRVQQTPAAKEPAAASTAAAPASTGTPAADIHIGEITLARGHLNYTDNFIKPNYTANITQLDGKIGGFGTAAGGPPAPITLQGQLDDGAPVDITGTINPLAPVAFLDIKGKADGVELTHLSTYSSKYTGYPITQGKLTADVHYQLDNRQLKADNHIFIDQLTFGDRVEGPGISHLPVKLAVALLKNSQGQIDVHLPVSGSLSDPKFSVGGLVWHALMNLIGRAVTSPFRLIASAFGGSGNHEDLGYVEFAPGSAVLDAHAQNKLAQIVKVLQQKPTLKLTVTGRIDPAFDEKGLRKVMVDDLVQQEAGDDANLAKLSTEQYDKYLKKAYKHAKFPKPRDFVGLAKSLPPEEMRKLLETHMPVDADALRHLAERRAGAVRKWLQGKINDSRVLVQAPKTDAKGIDDKGKTTRVDFGLQ